MVASVADAVSSDGVAAASDGLETFQDGNQDMWEGNWEGKKDQAESLRTEITWLRCSQFLTRVT